MHLTVLGPTGGTGRALVEQALAAGHDVRALVRSPAKLADLRNERLSLVEGDATARGDVARALEGAEAVLSALGQVKGSPPDVLARAAANVVAEMEARGLRRLLWVSGQGVPVPGDRPKVPDRLIVTALRRLQPQVLADATAAAEVIRASGLDYTLPRPPRLTDKPASGTWRAGMVGVGVGRAMARADLAAFMLDALDRGRYVREMPAVSN